jgi:hypothetical protein
MPPDVRHYGIWYRDEATFLRFKKACVDQENFEGGYQGWLSGAEKMTAEMKKHGAVIRRVYADADDFILWCKTNSFSPDQRARSRFAAIRGEEEAPSRN